MRNEGQYYTDDVRTAPAAPSSGEFADVGGGAFPHAYGGGEALIPILLMLFLLTLALAAGWLIGVLRERSERERVRARRAEHAFKTVDDKLKAALNAYGPDVAAKASELNSTLKDQIGPLLATAGLTSEFAKKLAVAMKGETKDKAKHDHPHGHGPIVIGLPPTQPTYNINTQSVTVAAGRAEVETLAPPASHAPPPAPAHGGHETTRSMTLEEQERAAREAIVALAQTWKRDEVLRLLKETDALLNRPVPALFSIAPKPAGPGPSAPKPAKAKKR